jgi:hypothetical protein
MAKNIDFQAIFIMNNSKLDFIQSVSEQKQKADQLQTSLHRLSETLKAFEMTIEQSEEPITQNSMLLQQVQRTTMAPQIASKLDIDRNRQSITPSHKRDDSELQSANRRIVDSASEYRYIGNIKSEIEHRFVFNINSGSTEPHQQPVAEHFDRQTSLKSIQSQVQQA